MKLFDINIIPLQILPTQVFAYLHFVYIFIVDYGSYPQHWLLFDRLVQQIVLQTSQAGQNAEAIVSEDNDPIAPLTNLNVKEIVHQLGQESEISDLRLRTEELEKENIELATNLSKKEQVRHT